MPSHSVTLKNKKVHYRQEYNQYPMKKILAIFSLSAALAAGSIFTITPHRSVLDSVPNPKFGGVPPPPGCPIACDAPK
jgi:hypothetical protein